MTFANNTPFAALDVPHPDHLGRPMIVAVVKASFTVRLDGELAPVERPREVRVNDELYDPDAPEGSVRLPTDVCVEKRGTDVIVVGEAVARKPVTVADVGVRVRDRQVPLRVHGPRVFVQDIADVTVGPAAPFERQPIVYERAFGGVADEGWTVESRNRAGVGVAKRAADLVGKPAPQIEHPARPHRRAGDAHPPVGYGAIRSHWSPRLELAGTFDETWQRTRMPLMPADFDLRANNVAHPSLVFDEPLRAGDPIVVSGMSEGPPLALQLPVLGVVVRGRSDIGGRVEVRPPIDTVIVEPSTRVLEITMRAAFPQGRGRDVLREIRVELG